jgi:hypothetical protein
MKRFTGLLLLAGLAIVGCDDSSQKIPEGASYKAPAGAQPGAANANTAEQNRMADEAKRFGTEMNQKYKR